MVGGEVVRQKGDTDPSEGVNRGRGVELLIAGQEGEVDARSVGLGMGLGRGVERLHKRDGTIWVGGGLKHGPVGCGYRAL